MYRIIFLTVSFCLCQNETPRGPMSHSSVEGHDVITVEAEVHNEPVVSPTPRPNRPKRLREPDPSYPVAPKPKAQDFE